MTAPLTRTREGKIDTVVVAEWSDGTKVVRKRLAVDENTVTFAVVGEGFRRMKPEGVGNIVFEIPTKEKESLFLPELRWVSEVLGLVPGGTAPFPSATTDHSESNPFIGRFVQRTLEEVRKDARGFDCVLREWISLGEKVPLYLPMTGVSSNFVDTYPKEWSDFLFSDGNFSVEIDRKEGPHRPYADINRPAPFIGSKPVSGRRFVHMEQLLTWMASLSKVDSDWAVLPVDDADRWWKENTKPGRLCLSDEELELYTLLGEPLPFTWDNRRLSGWAAERWDAVGCY